MLADGCFVGVVGYQDQLADGMLHLQVQQKSDAVILQFVTNHIPVEESHNMIKVRVAACVLTWPTACRDRSCLLHALN